MDKFRTGDLVKHLYRKIKGEIINYIPDIHSYNIKYYDKKCRKEKTIILFSENLTIDYEEVKRLRNRKIEKILCQK